MSFRSNVFFISFKATIYKDRFKKKIRKSLKSILYHAKNEINVQQNYLFPKQKEILIS